MNKKNIFKYTSIITGFALMGFLIGFLISISFSSKNNVTHTKTHSNNEKPQSVILNEETISSTPILPCYLLKNENEILTLYEINGNEKNVVKTVSINSQFFPPEDIKKLSNGIELSSIEEGFNLIADFSSWFTRKQEIIKENWQIWEYLEFILI